jgi:hypothetical protein
VSDDSVFAPTRHFLGWNWDTGAPVSLPLTAFLGRSVELVGKPGSGKTDLLAEACRTLTLSPSGYLYFDFAATGYDQQLVWDSYVAESLLIGVEPYADVVPELAGVTDCFIGRHGYATVGGPNPTIRINPFRHAEFPDGSRESDEDVVQRLERVFAAQYPDYTTVRVQFAKNLRMVAALLVAADQRISDWPKVFASEVYRRFLWRRHEETGAAGDKFIKRQRKLLEEILAYPPRELRAEIHSLTTSLEPLVSGSLAAFFSEENFRLEDVAYRGKRLFLSVSDLRGSAQKMFVMRAVWAMLDTLIAKRRFIDQEPIGVEIIDEIRWLPHDFFDQLALRRNNRWSSVTGRQLVHQFDGLGFKNAHEMSAAAAGTRIYYGEPESAADARELAAKIKLIKPGGQWVTRLVETHSAAQSAGSSLSRKESVAQVDTHTRTTGTGTAESLNALGVLTGTKKHVTASDGTTLGTHRGTGVDHGTSNVDTRGVSRTLQPFRIAYDEQLSYFAQELLRQPKHVATVITDELKCRVLMRRARQIPLVGVGAEIVENYIRLNTAMHRANTRSLPTFDPSIRVASSLSAPEPREERRGARLEPDVITLSPVPRRQEAEVAWPAEIPAHDDDATENCHDAGEGAESPGGVPARVALSLPNLAPDADQDSHGTCVLTLAATARFLTVQTVMLLSDWSYDKAYRELQSQRKAGLLDRFQPPVGREKGSAPSVYVLTGEGASRLAPRWHGGIEDLRRTVKNTGTKRRDVEEGNATNLHHALATTALFSLLARRVRTVDPTAVIDSVFWDRSLSIPVDVGPWMASLTPRERLLVSPEVAAGTTTSTTYVPDVTFRVTWQPPGYRERISELLLVELETGAGGKDSDQVGAVKGVKLAGVLAAAAESSRVGPIPVPNPRLVKALFWCGTASVEDGIRAGLRRVLAAPKRPVVTTNAALLPLTPPPGTAKKDLPSALQNLSQTIGEAVWAWYAQGDAEPRFGYPRTPSSPSPHPS